jgi:hypothetical protein
VRRVVLVLATAAIAWLVLETLVWLVASAVRGERFSFARIAARRSAAIGESAPKARTPASAATPTFDPLQEGFEDWRRDYVPHPFVGFVHGAGPEINELGFFGPSPLAPTTPAGAVRVAIVGGSFAAQLAVHRGVHLSAELSRRAFGGRPVALYNLAMGGMKQPQQLAALNWLAALGADFDLVLALDGFNEIALSHRNTRLGIHPHYPGLWGFHLAQLPDPDVERLVGMGELLRAARRRLALLAMRAPWSVTVSAAWEAVDELLGARLDAISVEIDERSAWRSRRGPHGAAVPEFVRGPAYSPLTREALMSTVAAIWQRGAALSNDEVCARGERYLHFLQPNQYVPGSKPMGDAERALALAAQTQRADVPVGYARLAAAGEELRREGVAFVDLRGVFSRVSEPLYVDSCCHVNQAGYELVADAMATAVAQELAARSSCPVLGRALQPIAPVMPPAPAPPEPPAP